MSTLTHDEALAGAPYHAGDPVAVEVDGRWVEATLVKIRPAPTARFGLRWAMRVVLDDGRSQDVRCDDQGRNHTYRGQVCPSSREV
jgi:hypothetical protein